MARPLPPPPPPLNGLAISGGTFFAASLIYFINLVNFVVIIIHMNTSYVVYTTV